MVQRITTRQQLIQDIRLSLGEPIIRVEVTDAHINQAIDMALKEFWKYHRDGSIESFYMYEATAEDVANGWIPVPVTVDAVIEVIPYGLGAGMGGWQSLEWQILASALSPVASAGASYTVGTAGGVGGTYGGNTHVSSYRYGLMGLGDWVMAQNYVASLGMMTGRTNAKQFTYARFARRLHLKFPFAEGDKICFRVNENVDPEALPENAEAFDDEFLKGLSCAYTRQVWGNILGKYQNIELPGGITMTGDQIYRQGKDEEDELMEEIKGNSLPFPLWVG